MEWRERSGIADIRSSRNNERAFDVGFLGKLHLGWCRELPFFKYIDPINYGYTIQITTPDNEWFLEFHDGDHYAVQIKQDGSKITLGKF